MIHIVKTVRETIQNHPLQFCLINFLIIATFLSSSYILGEINFRQQTDNSIQKFSQIENDENQNLLLLYYSPRTPVDHLDRIYLDFNDEIDPHSLEHALTTIPATHGTIQQGAHPAQLIYILDKPLERGTTLEFTIPEGLTSKNNKVALTNIKGKVSTTIADTDIQFVKDGLYGKVFTVPHTKQNTIAVEKGNDLEQIKINIYKSSKEKLLQFLTYDPAKNDEYNFGWNAYNSKPFKLTTLEHLEKDRVTSLTSSQQNTPITIDQPPGIYYFEASGENSTDKKSLFVLVNTTGVVFRQDDTKTVLAAFDVNTGQQQETKYSLSFLNVANSPKVLQQSDLLGVRTYEIPFQQQVDLALLENETETILVPVRIPLSQADIRVTEDLTEKKQIMLYTDRPIYKPGDTVYFRGIVRNDYDALYQLPGQQQVRIWYGSSTKPIFEGIKTTDEHGIFYGEFILPNNETTYGSLSASTNLSKEAKYTETAYATFEVLQYQKPSFILTASTDQNETIGKGTISFSVKGSLLDGSPYKNQTVAYKIYERNYFVTEKKAYGANFNISSFGGMCSPGGFEEYFGAEIKKGEVLLDEKGEGTVKFDTQELDNYTNSELTFVAEKIDENKNNINGTAKTIAYTGDGSLFFIPTNQNYYIGQSATIPFYIEPLKSASSQQREIRYELIQYNYSTSNGTNKTSILSGTTTTNHEGYGNITLTIPNTTNNSYYYLSATYKDDQQNVIENQQYVRVRAQTESTSYDFWNPPAYLSIRSANNSYVVNETIRLEVEAPETVDALLTLERGRIYQPKKVTLQKGKNIVEIPVTKELSPSITPVFSYFKDGRYHSEGLAINIPAMHQLLNVNLTTDKSEYAPNSQAKLTVTITDAKNNPTAAQFSLGVVDQAIYALRKNATPPIHSSFYFFRPRNTNASSSLTPIGTFLGGGGGGGGGGESINGKVIDTLYWAPNLQTNQNGTTEVTVDVKAYLTTWKAQVLASSDTTFLGQTSTDFIVK